ncbi:MAG: hypothetical protein NZM25_05655 [Leptospiraceae bacterium]|nr:hypothetical protein [Leptospiraceae bacterium]
MPKRIILFIAIFYSALEARWQDHLVWDLFANSAYQQNLQDTHGFGYGVGISLNRTTFSLLARNYVVNTVDYYFQAHLLLRAELREPIAGTGFFYHYGASLGLGVIERNLGGPFGGLIGDIFSGFSYPLNQHLLLYGRVGFLYGNYFRGREGALPASGTGFEFGLRYSEPILRTLDY